MSSVAQRFDQRSLAMLCSQVGAVPLIAFGLASDSFLMPGTHWVLALVGVFTLFSVALTIRAGKLSDQQFTLDGFGGMLGIAASAAVIALTTDTGDSPFPVTRVCFSRWGLQRLFGTSLPHLKRLRKYLELTSAVT